MVHDRSLFTEHVWVQFNDPLVPFEMRVPRGCHVVRHDSGGSKGYLVRDLDGKEAWVPKDWMVGAMHAGSLNPVDDMAQLDDLQEYSVLHNLHLRYTKKMIYTYIGTMLVAVNPYEALPLYTQEKIKAYDNQKFGNQPPHIFAIADNAYSSMMRHDLNQSIVISGESGAGKTESTKFILQYLVAKNGQQTPVQHQIIDTNKILECFGNAKTTHNDNSSRFGKYVDVNFNRNGVIEGAQIEYYLLEKSRIVFQNSGERNYHIFYCMLNGLTKDEKRRLDVGDVSQYNYLTSGTEKKQKSSDDKADAAMFQDLRKAMQVLRFSNEEMWDIFNILTVILHMGNMKYKRLNVHNMEASELSDSSHVQRAASGLGVSKSALMAALTKKTILIQGERVVSGISKEQALAVTDTLVKTMYDKLFNMIVDKINQVIAKTKHQSRTTIGVLDIFGFENFNSNSFEQLCINYANESLQQFFVKHIFKMEQDCYVKEGVDWTLIDFVDNVDVLDMLGNKYVNIFALIDEESKFPKGNDLSMLAKLHNAHSTKSIYLKPKSDTRHCFGIRHFAGPVYYDVQGFLEKNRDSFNLDLKFLVAKCENRFLKYLFKSDLDGTDATTQKRITLASQFKDSLDELIKTLSNCNPFFIRCIKPNEFKKANLFDASTCVRQLRYSGLMDTARIRKAGYPVRHTYLDFSKRYRPLIHNAPKRYNSRGITEQIYRELLAHLPPKTVVLGHSKIFLKQEADRLLESELGRIYDRKALIVQNTVRMWMVRTQYKKLRRSVVVLKSCWKTQMVRKDYQTMKEGVSKLQAAIKSRQLAFRYKLVKKNMPMFQARCRGFLVRRRVLQKLLQKKQRRILDRMKSEDNSVSEPPRNERIIAPERREKVTPAPIRNMKSVINELSIKQKLDSETKLAEKHQPRPSYLNRIPAPQSPERKDLKPKRDLSKFRKFDDEQHKVNARTYANNQDDKLLFIGNKLNARPKTMNNLESGSATPAPEGRPLVTERKFINAARGPDRFQPESHFSDKKENRPRSAGALEYNSRQRPVDNNETIRYVDDVFGFLNSSQDNRPHQDKNPNGKSSGIGKFFNTFRRPAPVPRKFKQTGLGS